MIVIQSGLIELEYLLSEIQQAIENCDEEAFRIYVSEAISLSISLSLIRCLTLN